MKLKNCFGSLVLLGLSLSGTAFAGGPPSPAYFMGWQAPIYVKKALLECGATDVESKDYIFSQSEREAAALVGRCMINSGLHPAEDFGVKISLICQKYPELAACSTTSGIPQRDVNRRLNSEYCQSKRTQSFARMSAVNKVS